MTGEQVFQELIDLAVFIAAKLYIFLEGKVAGSTSFFRRVKSSNGRESDAVEFFARMLR